MNIFVAHCPACKCDRFERVSTVAVKDLGYCWAMDRLCSSCHDYPSVQQISKSAADWTERIEAAVHASEISFYRCEQCQLEVASPSKCWAEGQYTEDENYPIRWEFERFLDDLGPIPRRILELGCGTGVFLDLARKRGHSVVGVDFSSNAVSVARSKGLDVVCGGFDTLQTHVSQEDLRFDAVAMFHVIEHLPRPESVLMELSRFVKKDSLLGISCPGPRRFTKFISVQQVKNRDFWDYPPHHVLRWNPRALSSLLERNSWSVIQSLEEPLIINAAAAQWGVTTAMWKGYRGSAIRRRFTILVARLRLFEKSISGRCAGLSLYTLAKYGQS